MYEPRPVCLGSHVDVASFLERTRSARSNSRAALHGLVVLLNASSLGLPCRAIIIP